VAYYRAISDAGKIPIHIQNYMPPVGTDMPAKTLARLIDEVEQVTYIKEETLPVTHKLTQVLKLAGPKLKGVVWRRRLSLAAAGVPSWLVRQYAGLPRYRRLWSGCGMRLRRATGTRAKHVYGMMAPLFAIENQCPGAIYKETLVMRGVIKSAYSRNRAPDVMDEEDHRALNSILADLEPLFTWHA